MIVREFYSLDEIRDIPGFVEWIGRDGKHQLRTSLGFYRLKKTVHCAVGNHPHNFGFVFETTGGKVVMVGNICGKDDFVGFLEMRHNLIKQIGLQDKQKRYNAKLSSLTTFRQRAKSLLPGVKQLEVAVLSLHRICSPKVIERLYVHVNENAPLIKRTRERTKKGEKEPTYIEEELGRFRGLKALSAPPPRVTIESKVLDQMPQFQSKTVDELIANQGLRRVFDAYHGDLERSLQRVEACLSAANEFFDPDNLRLLTHLARNPTERETLSRLRWNNEKGIVEVSPHGHVKSLKAG